MSTAGRQISGRFIITNPGTIYRFQYLPKGSPGIVEAFFHGRHVYPEEARDIVLRISVDVE